MSERFAQYQRISRQPMTSLFFVLPLLLLYEVGIRVMSHPAAHSGGGVWLRDILTSNLGLSEYVVPLLPIVTLVVWQMLENRPARTPPGMVPEPNPSDVAPKISFRQRLGVLPDMLPESVILALGLRLLLGVEAWGVEWLTGDGPAFQPMAPMTLRDGVAMFISHCGAGLYEEFLFRLILTGGLVMLIRSYLSERSSWLISIGVSSILFVIAHHWGPGGEPVLWQTSAFQLSVLFRFSASVVLGLLYWKRGFGVTVGAHICYNLFIRIV